MQRLCVLRQAWVIENRIVEHAVVVKDGADIEIGDARVFAITVG